VAQRAFDLTAEAFEDARQMLFRNAKKLASPAAIC
jgi:hypothetical protein